MQAPEIKVQLIHIDGPLKGEIQEFIQQVITLGRHPECAVVFPKSCTAISRKHAVIQREGNRFKLIDQSTNGTLVNGKPHKETFLKNGDVLIFGGVGGPKVSFLCAEATAEEITALQHSSAEKVQAPVHSKAKHKEIVPEQDSEEKPPKEVTPSHHEHVAMPADNLAVPQKPAQNTTRPEPVTPVPSAAKSFVIQYGATLNSFKNLPVIVGSGAACDCTLQHPALLEQHLQIFFRDNQYWVKDLTGRNLLSINDQPVGSESPLAPDSRLALSTQGPTFQFLGEGRLAEVATETTSSQSSSPAPKKSRKKKAAHQTNGHNKKTMQLLLIFVLLGVLITAAWFFLFPLMK